MSTQTVTETVSNTETDSKELHNESHGSMKRRTSIRPSDRNQSDSIAPLLKSGEFESVPGSIPVTPGDEMPQKVFESSYDLNDNKHTIPTQRPNLYRKDTRFIENENDTSNNDSNVSINVSRENQTPLEGVEPSDKSPLPPMTFTNPPKNLWRVIAVCIWSFTGGFSDGAPGALLPYIEEYYGISYSIVSLIWMSNAVGFILVALFSHKIVKWLGSTQRCMAIASLISCIMFIFVLIGSKFPLIVVGFFFGGVGLAISLSQMNIFLSGLEKSSTALGYCHGSYGFGASVSPLIATQFVNHGVPWHYFYLILLGLMLTNAVNCYFAFAGATENSAPWNDAALEESEDTVHLIETTETSNPTNETEIGMQNLNASGNSTEQNAQKPPSDMSLALKNRVTWLLSLFVLFYQGAEVSMGGWIVTYLLSYRGGNPKSVGYVASGFWFGLTLGRLFLTRLFHKYIGARRGVIVMAVISIICIILTWVLPSVLAAGICVSIAGVFIGPTYPLMVTLASKILPRKIQVVSLTIMTAFGSSGGAIFPFIVGLISQYTGAYVVLPIFISLYSTMLISWLLLPNIEQREKHGNLNWWQKLW